MTAMPDNRSEWISVDERLPEPETSVIVWSEYWSRIPFVAQLLHGRWVGWNILSEPAGVTHWMPLPAPPKEAPNAK